MMEKTSYRPFLMERLRRARWLAFLVLPFFLLSAVESINATEVLTKELAKRNFKKETAKRQGMTEEFLLDPEAYLKQTLKKQEANKDKAVETIAKKAGEKGPDHKELKRVYKEQVRQARFRHFEELREDIRRMMVKSMGGKVTDGDWKAVDLKLKNIAKVGKQIRRESKEETKSLSKRGAGLWKRFRYSSQQKKMIDRYLKLAEERETLIRERNLGRMVKLLDLNRKEELSRKEYKPQFRSIQADLQNPGKPKAKSDGTRRRAQSLAPAQVEWVRLADGGGGVIAPPTPAPTYGESIDPSVVAFAQEHGYDAGRIFKAIYDRFEFEPYYGIAKSARGTLLDRKGNDWDLALLLRDALRISGYEAELEHGLVENEFSELAQFLGVDNPDKVSYILATAGIPGSIIQDGTRKFARFEHVWVAAKVPFDDYRGRPGSAGERQWIDLDPSFKTHTLKAGISVTGGLTFPFDDYIAKAQGRSPQEYFEDSLWLFMKRAAIVCNTLSEIPLQSEILPLAGSYLPNGLKSTRTSTIGSYRSAPDAYKKKLKVTLEGTDGDELLSRTMTLEEALYRSVTFTYGPASNNDSLIIHSYGGLENTPPYLLRLRPELRVDGQVVQVGDEIGAGRKLQVRLDISGQRLNVETDYFPAVAGAEMALVLAQGGISAGSFTQHISTLSKLQNDATVPERARIAQERYLLGAKYYHEIGRSAERLAGYFNYRYVGGVHAGFASTKYVVGGLFGLANTWSKQGTVFSAERFVLGMVPLNSNVATASPVFNRLFGSQTSFLEHQSGESLNNKDFVSTVKIFQLAIENEIGLDTLTAANLESKLPSFSFLDAEAVADIRNATGLGRIVILPEAQVTRNQWTGTGYISLNNTTGSAEYIISGRFAGGDETGDGEGGGDKAGCECSNVASRIYHSNGQYVDDYTELIVPTKGIPAVFAFGYNNQRQYPSEMGYGWEHTFGRRLYIEAGGAKVTFYNEEQLAQVFRDSSGTYLHPAGFFASLKLESGLYKMRRKDNITWTFSASGQLLSILNLDGLGLFVDTTAQGLPDRVKDVSGSTLLTFHYQGDDLTSVQDTVGRNVAFDIDGEGDLASFTNSAGEEMSFTYFQDHNMESKVDGLNHARFFLYDQRDRLMEFTNARGHVTSYIHDDEHRQFVEVDPAGQELTSFYDDKGFPILKVDGNGNRESARYDATGNLVFKQDSRGFTYEATFDGLGNKLTERLPDSTLKFYVYDTLNLTTKDSNATEGLVTRYESTSKGHLQQQNNPDGTSETFLYDSEGQLLRKVGRAEDTTQYAYNLTGGVDSIVDPVGQVTRYLYDSLGRMAGFVNGVGDSTRIILDGKDRIVAMKDGEGFQTSIFYDAAGNRTALVNPMGDTTRFFLDENNNVIATVLPDRAIVRQEFNELNQAVARVDALGRRTQYEYDKEHSGGRLIKVVDPLGQTIKSGYCGEEADPCNQIDKQGFVTKTERDGQYRLKSVTDALGNKVSYTYDRRGNKTSMTDGEGRVTHYGYDAESRLVRVIGALNDTTRYEYNTIGQRIFDINASGDTVAYFHDKAGRMIMERDQMGNPSLFDYDNAGRTSRKVDAKGDTTKYFYTKKGQIKEIRYQDGMVELFRYDGLGHKIEEGNGFVSYTYRHDKVGRILEFQNHALAKVLKYEYDLAGNKTAQINAEGERAEYRYDALNRLSEIQDVNGGVTRFEYDKMGNRTQLLYPNGVRTVYTYDSAYRLLEMGHFGRDNALLAGYNYTYDKVGNRKAMTDARGTHTYEYDELYRLTGVTYPEGRTQEWEYDATGNRLWEIETLPGQAPDTTLYHYSKDRLDSTTGAVAQSYAYDANGSMTQRGAEVFRYDAKMRLREARVPGQPVNTMTYDPMGLRVQTVSGEGKIGYLIDPSSNHAPFNAMSVAAEYKNGLRSREFGLGTRADEVLWEENEEGLFYLLYDGLGSVVAATNANGQVVAQMAYDVFGKVFSQSGQAGDMRYSYTGRPKDKDVELQYNRARYYDAGVGRWNRADEWRGDLMVPASLQRYMYVNQNPVSFRDPSGFSLGEAAWAGWKGLITSINLMYKLIGIGVALSLLTPEPISIALGIKLIAFALTVVAWVNAVFTWALKQNDVSTADNVLAALLVFSNTALMMASLVALSGGVVFFRTVAWAIATTVLAFSFVIVNAEIFQADPSAPSSPKEKGSCP